MHFYSLIYALISVDNLLTHSLKVGDFTFSSVSPFKPACLLTSHNIAGSSSLPPLLTGYSHQAINLLPDWTHVQCSREVKTPESFLG